MIRLTPILLVAACNSPKNCEQPWPFNCNTADAPPDPPVVEGYEPTYTLTCGYAGCEPVYVELNRAAALACFTSGTAPNQQWIPGTPGQVLYACGIPQNTGNCMIQLDGCGLVDSSSEPDPTCVDDVVCAAAGQASVYPGQLVVSSPDGHCTWDYAEAYSGLTDQVRELEAALDAGKSAACPIVFDHSIGIPTATPDAASECNLGVACNPATARVWAPGSTHAMAVDSASSWVKLTKPGTVTTIPVSGSFAFDLAAAGGLHVQAGRGLMPDTLYGGNDHSNIVTGLAAPITLSPVSGHPTWYTASAAQVGDRLIGKAGMPDPLGTVVRRLHPSGTAVVKLAGSAWTLDYSQNVSGSYYGSLVVQVHLAGTWSPVTP